jgi:DNA-binding transcriptional regulator GbsR (MarR family)
MKYEKSLFVEYLGDSPYVRVLDYFIMNDTFDCSLQDIADYTGLSRNTITKVLRQMLKLDIIIKTREIGRANMTQLNKSNPYVAYLKTLDLNLSKLYSSIVSVKHKHESLLDQAAQPHLHTQKGNLACIKRFSQGIT